MTLAASEHACPHLREAVRAEARVAAAPARPAGCPSGRDRAPSEPVRASVALGGGASGWWAFASAARAEQASA